MKSSKYKTNYLRMYLNKIKYFFIYLYEIPRNYIHIKKYPWLIDDNFYNFYDGLEKYTYTWFSEIPCGWRKAFGKQLVKDIDCWLKEHNITDFKIIQLKEKFGGLRIYHNAPYQLDEDVIRKYEELSVNTCIRCGKPAKYFSTGWISPFCEKCKNKYPGRYTTIKLNEQ